MISLPNINLSQQQEHKLVQHQQKIAANIRNKDPGPRMMACICIAILAVVGSIVLMHVTLIMSHNQSQSIGRPNQSEINDQDQGEEIYQSEQPDAMQIKMDSAKNHSKLSQIQKNETEQQKTLRESRIRNEITKRKIYIQKYLTSLEQQLTQSPQPSDSINSSQLSYEQFKSSLCLINLTGRPLQQSNNLFQQQNQYYDKKYKINQYKELPFCIVVPTYMNLKNYKYYFNVHSIISQNYTKFRVVFIDDASTDGTGQQIEQELKRWNRSQQKQYLVVKNLERKGHMANIYESVRSFCRKGEILMVVDGDDQLIGINVLKTFNAFYHKAKPLTLYSNHIRSTKNSQFSIGTSLPYTPEIKLTNSYRTVHHNYSHLKTTWVDLFHEIREDSLKDEEGRWFTNAVDNAFYFCVMEMSCGEVEYLPELMYKYNMFTGNNVFEKDQRRSRVDNAAKIKMKMPYKCIKQTKIEVYERIKKSIENLQ